MNGIGTVCVINDRLYHSLILWLLFNIFDKTQIDFQLINGEYNQITNWLRRGLVDCGFVSLPAANDLDASFLLQDTLVAILPEDHPLADAPVYPIERLSSEDFINLKEEQDYEITKFLDHLQQKPNIRYEVSNDYAILSMVECGLGISVVHELMLHPNRYHICPKKFDIPQVRDIGIAVKKDVPPSTITRLFVEHAKQWARENLPCKGESAPHFEHHVTTAQKPSDFLCFV